MSYRKACSRLLICLPIFSQHEIYTQGHLKAFIFSDLLWDKVELTLTNESPPKGIVRSQREGVQRTKGTVKRWLRREGICRRGPRREVSAVAEAARETQMVNRGKLDKSGNPPKCLAHCECDILN